MIEYQKLVRDKIPQIIRNSGHTPITRVLDDEEYLDCLEKKLDEEVAEFHRDCNGEELADILEVVYALAASKGFSKEDLSEIYQKKHEVRGGFEKKLLLIASE